MFIDIHTHKPNEEGTYSIQNLHEQFENCNPLFLYSIGIHPCYINTEDWKNIFTKLKLESKKSNVIMIGECGLDRLSNVPFNIQQDVFIQHILWANEIAKPLIIHCVKAHNEVLHLLKDHQCNVPVIFHGFNNKKEIAEIIVTKGYFISFGKAFYNPSVETIFNTIPLDNIFLETDDSDSDIQSIYSQAAKIKNISMDQLSLQLKKNFKKVFNSTTF